MCRVDFGTPGGGLDPLPKSTLCRRGVSQHKHLWKLRKQFFRSLFLSSFCEREVEENEEGQWNKVILYLSPDASVMEETIQCLPQELRTLHPKRWSTDNVSPWVTSERINTWFRNGENPHMVS